MIVDLTGYSDDEEPKLIGSTSVHEDEFEEEEEEFLVYTSTVLIKGIRYYNGVAHEGEYVHLNREPSNVYDRNAIRVDNLSMQKVGHIQKEVAAALAPLMDSNKATIEATIPRPSRTYDQECNIAIYANSSNFAFVQALLARLSHRCFKLEGTKAKSQSGVAAAPSPSVVASKKTVTYAKSQESLEELVDNLDASKSYPEFDPSIISRVLLSRLFAHQLQGVAFLIHRETDSSLPPFWSEVVEKGVRVCINNITHSSQSVRPPPVLGGILADDMGVGKSLQIIALILARPPPNVKYNSGALQAAVESSREAAGDSWEHLSSGELQKICKKHKINSAGSKSDLIEKLSAVHMLSPDLRVPIPVGERKTTLIVCPVSVIQGWIDQLTTHVAPFTLRVYNYSSQGRISDLSFLKSMDIIFVSYNILVTELANGPPVTAGSKRGRDAQGILAMEFWRIVLDEAHTIRNRRTQTFKACMALSGAHRWALTGTPIQNKVDDAYPLLAFLRAEPCSQWDIFNRAVVRPLKEGNPDGITRLRALFSGVSLRRNKQLISTMVPAKTIELHTLHMSPAQLESYLLVFRSAQGVVRAALAAAAANNDPLAGKIFTGILECILRLRQCCDCQSMIPSDRLQRAADVLAKMESGSSKALSAEDALNLFVALQGALNNEAGGGPTDCCICMEELGEETSRILKKCKHVLCETCVEALLGKPPCSCPLCRAAFTRQDVLDAFSVREAAGENERKDAAATGADRSSEDDSATSALPPPKIAALVEGLSAMRVEDAAQKAIVFSQFTSFLDTCGRHLKHNGVRFSRLDGSMSQKKRSGELQKWRLANSAGGTTALIISTKAGGQGLNLCEGNKVFLMDPLWNNASEEQAMDRCHRLGQTRPVTVVRYVMENSIEEKILKLQSSKAAINKGALVKLSREELAQVRMAEYRTLFEL